MLDYHVHTSLCGHALGEMEDFVRVAKERGLSEMGFADHFPLYFLHASQRDPSLAMSFEQLPLYIERVTGLRHRFAPFPIRLGIEADYVKGCEQELGKLLTGNRFDYVYGSIHFIGDWDVSDERQAERYRQVDIVQLYETYFELVQRAALSRLFDVIGHADVVKKFGYKPDKPLKPLYDRTAQVLGRAGVCIEVNTAGLRVPAREIYPAREFLECCFQHDVPVVLGSDAHRPDDVGRDFEIALELIKAVGYRYITRFAGRRKSFLPI